MANADQIKALIRSHGEGDETRFYAVAMQVAALAARNGHARFAQELRDLVDEAKGRAKREAGLISPRPIPIAQPRGELSGLLTVSYGKLRVTDMALDDVLRTRIDRVLLEQRQRNRIREHGLTPMRKLLLVGPPGTGKTMTAAAVSGELGLPLFTIQLDGLITKYMGETASKLRLVFDAMQETRGVYFFDEFDALGAERGNRNDVGEIRRVLNSFLQLLELDESDSLIICATNHEHVLDRALFRRFDAVFEYGLPSREVAVQVMRARLALLDTSAVDWSEAFRAATSLSHAEIARACEQAAKEAILDNTTIVRNQDLERALADRRATHV
jgi:SpoVK/Ycf46/Vps4 family AAA+-type ATPase